MPQKTTCPAICILLPLTLLGLLYLTACASAPKASSAANTGSRSLSVCPDLEAGETGEDCPWASVARDLTRTADQGGSVPSTLAVELPALVEKFHVDLDRKDWLTLWGRSINFDELAHGIILNPAIANTLSSELGAPAPEGADSRIVHAGIEHTYGYLFSLLNTPYGFKRARWVKPTIDRGFGFDDPTVSPLPKLGTLLGNVTYFMGRIAFRDEPARLAALKIHENTVPYGLRVYDYGQLKVRRLEERVQLSASRAVVLRTDLVEFPHAVDGETNTHLLIYSVNDSRSGGSVLITAFPVTKSFVEMALNPKNLGHDQPVVSRYNAYIVDMSGRKLRGSREVTP